MFLLSKDYVPRRFKCDAKLGQCLADSGAHCNTPFVQSDEKKYWRQNRKVSKMVFTIMLLQKNGSVLCSVSFGGEV